MVRRPQAFYHGSQPWPFAKGAGSNPMGRKTMSILQSAVASIALTATLLSSAASADTFAYVANADSNDINAFRVEPANGKIEAVETVAFPGVEKAGLSTPLAVSPDRHFLFAGLRAEPYVVLSFAIDAKS